MNYWQTKKIHWYDYKPENIFIKRNKVSSHFEDEIQTASYKTKGGFVDFLNEDARGRFGNIKGKAVGVAVRLHGLKNEFPCAEIDFTKYGLNKNYSNGTDKFISPNAIAYITSDHRRGKWVRNPITNDWDMEYASTCAMDDEGYQVHFSANQSQFGGDRFACQEILDISWAVVDFLVERVVPHLREQKEVLTLV
jgi:hypothetical protein